MAAMLLALSQATAALDAPTEFIGLAVYPSQVALNHADDFQQMVAVATRADGVTLDVTKLANWQVLARKGKSLGQLFFPRGSSLLRLRVLRLSQ